VLDPARRPAAVLPDGPQAASKAARIRDVWSG